jgi:alpha-tubulin suppressor-like RCC1 family protein
MTFKTTPRTSITLLRRALVATATLGALGIAGGCGAEAPGDQVASSVGEVSLPLRTVTGDGVYQLWPANFVVTGKGDVSDITLDLKGGKDALSLTTDLPVGEYDVEIKDDWGVRRLDPATGGFVTVPVSDRMLITSEVQTVTISEQEVSNLVFDFLVGEDLIRFGQGRLGISAEVSECAEISHSACYTQCTDDSDCGEAMVCDKGAAQCAAEYGKLVSLSVGQFATCGLDAENTTYCWGAGYISAGSADGSLPAPLPMPEGVRFQEIAVGGYFACGLDLSGAAYCWGIDAAALGDGGNTSNTSTPVPVTMPAGVRFVSLDASWGHVCALNSVGEMYCWGANSQGQLGVGDLDDRNVPSPVNLPYGVSARSIAAGVGHTCLLDVMGRAWCWGSNGQGELGIGPGMASSVSPQLVVDSPWGTPRATIDAGLYHTCAVTVDGMADCWGQGSNGELGNESFGTAFVPSSVFKPESQAYVQIAAGSNFSCIVDGYKAIECTGDALGLADGSTDARAVYGPTATPPGLEFADVGAGYRHACGLTTDGDTYCWGWGKYGQLGNGGGADQLLPVKVVW